jgi:hypothetical protein
MPKVKACGPEGISGDRDATQINALLVGEVLCSRHFARRPVQKPCAVVVQKVDCSLGVWREERLAGLLGTDFFLSAGGG